MATAADRPYVWLSLVESLEPKQMVELLSICEKAQDLMEMQPADWSRVVGDATASLLLKARSQVDRAIDKLEKMGIRIITRANTDYPVYLQEVYDPPAVLYAKGSAPLNHERMIAVIGARECTRYGREAGFTIGAQLAREGVCVVSGAARGIDTASHEGAMSVGGVTIGVLGCGLNKVYPPENAKVYERIMENGAIVSEYLPSSPPYKAHFPRRNRIMAGMSQGVVVVEAALRSGTNITIDYALEHGREVFAMPGNITSRKSEGTNKLIYEGKCMARNAKDILFGMGWESVQDDKTLSKKAAVAISEDEKKVIAQVADEEMSFEELVNATGFDASRLNSLLTMLVMQGIMKQSPGRMFSLNREQSGNGGFSWLTP